MGKTGWVTSRPPRAFSAAFVVLPEASFLFTSLMTPTATVCFMSRTAKRPRGAYFWKVSTHMGLLGTIFTMQESPDLICLGLASISLPVRLSIFWISSANLQAICAVWQSSTGE
ncbi:hypothetical protein E2C01_037039 [Portunus trituberculatus]|uniref:Uncharacterized protein n=1 Tax=Portunus trituberculatus TaxID=210409 RepID=A0A5B7FG04_PORTR|nr:hypothetical protein [Portunus trituberculatus]